MEVTGPFTLTLGTETDVTPPNGSTRFTRVVLANASPFACQINADGVAQWLQPWSADIYPTSSGNPVQVTPRFTTATASTNAQITASWYLDTDPLNGSYPAALTAQGLVITNSITANLAAGSSVSINGTPTVNLAGSPTVQIGNTPTVDIGGSVTVGNITAGNVAITNAAGATGVNVAPKTTDFMSRTGSGVLLGGTTKPAYNVTMLGASNNTGTVIACQIINVFTGNGLTFYLGQGNVVTFPVDFILQAGQEIQCNYSGSASTSVTFFCAIG